MKKIRPLLILNFLFLNLVSTAKIDPQKLEFGLGVSPCFGWAHSNSKYIQSNGLGLNFGFGAKINYALGDKYGIGMEVNLQNVSTKIHFGRIDVVKPNGIDTLHSSNFEMAYAFQYIEIPIMLKMRTEENNDLRYYGEFGAAINILLNQKADITSNGFSLTGVNTQNPEDGDHFKLLNTDNINTSYSYKVSPFRLGLVLGGGVQYLIKNNSRIDLGLRYNAGLTDILGDSKLQLNNSYLSLNIGFIF